MIILDSGFCVLKALITLRKNGVFASGVVKKRGYWPSLIPGNKINKTMKDAEVGATASL